MKNEKMKVAGAIWTKIAEKVVKTWESGLKGKAICIGGAVVVLLVLMQCCGGGSGDGKKLAVVRDAEVSPEIAKNDIHLADGARDAKNMGGSGEANGDDWKYSGKDFSRALYVSAVSDQFDGVIYRHFANSGIKVLQAKEDGNLVKDAVAVGEVWVETEKRYADGETLGRGFYIRRGRREVEIAGRGKVEVARYVEVTDKGILAKIRKQIEEEEGKPLELKVPVKSLCGFAIGATPSSIEELFKSLSRDGDIGKDRKSMSGQLVKPFRYCDNATMEFSTKPPLGGQHLCRVELSGRAPLETSQERRKEVETIVSMLEKKFGIEFRKKRKDENDPNCLWVIDMDYKWATEGGADSIRQSIEVRIDGDKVIVEFESDLMSPKEWNEWVEKQKPPKLSTDAGADQL